MRGAHPRLWQNCFKKVGLRMSVVTPADVLAHVTIACWKAVRHIGHLPKLAI